MHLIEMWFIIGEIDEILQILHPNTIYVHRNGIYGTFGQKIAFRVSFYNNRMNSVQWHQQCSQQILGTEAISWFS